MVRTQLRFSLSLYRQVLQDRMDLLGPVARPDLVVEQDLQGPMDLLALPDLLVVGVAQGLRVQQGLRDQQGQTDLRVVRDLRDHRACLVEPHSNTIMILMPLVAQQTPEQGISNLTITHLVAQL